MSADYSELRRLLEKRGKVADDNWDDRADLATAAVEALPGLLDENDRLVSKLAIANRTIDEQNQSITELQAEVARMHQADQDEILRVGALSRRIAQLKAALLDYLARADNGDYAYNRAELDGAARHALEGKEPT